MARERDVQDKQVRNLAKKHKLSDDQQEQLHKLINTSHTSINSYVNSLAVWETLVRRLKGKPILSHLNSPSLNL